MRISELQLLEMANAYIENGILKKWRYGAKADPLHIDSILERKRQQKETLTEDETKFIMEHDRVIDVRDSSVSFHNFSGTVLRY